MKGSLLANRPALGGTALGACLALVAVALIVLAFGLEPGQTPSPLLAGLVMLGVIAFATILLIVGPATDQEPTAPVSAEMFELPWQPAEKPVYDWAVSGC